MSDEFEAGRGAKTVNVSDRLRDALERLDQAIDRLDAQLPAARAGTVGGSDGATGAFVAARLDRIIERIETALAD